MTSDETKYRAFKEGFLVLLRDISFAHGFYSQCEQSDQPVAEVMQSACNQVRAHLLKHLQPLNSSVTPRHSGKPARTLMKQARWSMRALSLAPPTLVSA